MTVLVNSLPCKVFLPDPGFPGLQAARERALLLLDHHRTHRLNLGSESASAECCQHLLLLISISIVNIIILTDTSAGANIPWLPNIEGWIDPQLARRAFKSSQLDRRPISSQALPPEPVELGTSTSTSTSTSTAF